MYKFILLITLSLSLHFRASCADCTSLLTGIWEDEKGESRCQFEQKGTHYIAKIVWLKTPLDTNGHPLLDKKNPEPHLQKRGVMGVEIFSKLKCTGDKLEGTAYSPKRGGSAKCTLKVKDPKTCIVTAHVGFISFSQTFKRVQ